MWLSYRRLVLLVLSAGAVFGQTCSPNAAATTIHAEGLAEPMGDIVLSCTGGTAGVVVAASVFVAYSANVTNRIDGNGAPLGIALTVTGPGGSGNPIALNSPTLLTTGFRYTVPATPATPVVVTLSGVRSGVGLSATNTQPITAAITVTGLQFPSAGVPIVVANPTPSFTGSTLNAGLPCGGSPLPATLDFNSFASTSLSSVVRVTESSVTAFAAKRPGDDTGIRLVLRLTGYGAGVRIFVPDAIVGSTGTAPTATSAFFGSVASGTYTPGLNQLLLSRVDGASSAGAGGTTVQAVPGVATTFTSMTELAVTGGNAFAVYEVMDASPVVRELAYLPVFFVYAQNNCSAASQTALSVAMGPTSTVNTATASDPIPRFAAITLASDCTLLNDCNASYFPHLTVDQTSVAINGSSLGPKQLSSLRLGNSGSAQLVFAVTVTYPAGNATGWLTPSPTSGVNNVTVQLTADPGALQPGTYGATVNINAGSAGQATIPVVFTVGQPGVTAQALVNAASFLAGGVVPGSYAALFGLNMGGANVGVTFDGLPAVVVYKSATQINLLVPSTLAVTSGASNVVVTADGKQSNTLRVGLQPNLPGIFTPGIVNADGTVNSSAQPAALGSTVAVYLTGLTIPPTGQVTLSIGSFTGLVPAFVGAQPTYPGLDQVNVQIPQFPTASTYALTLCIPGLTGQAVCSNTVNLYTK